MKKARKKQQIFKWLCVRGALLDEATRSELSFMTKYQFSTKTKYQNSTKGMDFLTC